jgi:hypothetical protein
MPIDKTVDSNSTRVAPAFKAARFARSMLDLFVFCALLLIEVVIVLLLTAGKRWRLLDLESRLGESVAKATLVA